MAFVIAFCFMNNACYIALNTPVIEGLNNLPMYAIKKIYNNKSLNPLL